MKTWQKIALGVCGSVAVAAVILGYSIYRHVTHTIPDCYAQWATAEMVLGYREARNEMPKTWGDLEPYYTVSSPHHGGLSFEDIRSRIKIDFTALPKLALRYEAQADIPEVIQTVSGIQSHWDGAEPNKLVNYEIHKPTEPNQRLQTTTRSLQ